MPIVLIGSAFRVDQDGAGGGEGDTQVKVQVLNDGSFAFVWRELEDNQTDHFRIFARKYGSDLAPLTGQVKIDGAMRDQAGNGFSTPSIVATGDGGFVVEYDDFGGGTLYSNGQPYDDRVWTWLAGFNGAGALTGQTPLLGVPDSADPVQNRSISNSTIAADGKGGYHSLVVQNVVNNPDARSFLVNGQKVDIGLAPGGYFIQVNTDIADAGESALIAWNRGVSNSDSDIYAMIVGQPMVRVNSQTQGLQLLSPGGDALAALSNGSYVLVWSDVSTQDEASDPGEGVRARILGGDGVPIGPEIILPADAAGNETRPMVVALANGYWIAAWVDERGTVSQIFDVNGARFGGEQVLIPGYSGFSAMTVLPGDKVVMTWQERSDSAVDRTMAQAFQVLLVNFPPGAGTDHYDTLANTKVIADAAHGVLANDIDYDGDPITAVLASDPQHGIVTLNPDGSFEYKPDFGYRGQDYFTYQVHDDKGNASIPTMVFVEIREPTGPNGEKLILVQEFNNFLYEIGLPAEFDETVFTGFWGELMLAIIGELFQAYLISQTFGSLVLNIDADADGVAETRIEFDDPVFNLVINVEPAGDRTHISFDPLTPWTTGNDTIAGTAGLDYLGGDAGNDILRGLAGNDALTGGDGNDILFPGSGTDSVRGDAGNDGLYFGAELDATDKADGGDGTDTLAIQGQYVDLLLAGISQVEVLSLLSGSDTRFGDIAGNRYDYIVRSADLNVAAGMTMTISATGLLPGEDLGFDGSAETDGNFRIFAGQGVDKLTGGAGNDGFFFGADGNYTAADRIDGGAGIDSLALRGNYVGAGAIVFQDASLANIEVLTLLSGHTNEYSGIVVASGYDYDVTIADGNLAAGQRLDVIAARLGGDESLRFDGHLENNGSFRILSGSGNDRLIGGAQDDLIYGGLGADAIDGGAGSDIYLYRATAESTAAAADTLNFASGDRIDLSFIDADGAGTADAFSFIGASAFSRKAGELRLFQTLANMWTVEGDTDGDGAADLSIIVNAAAPLVAGDFVL